jgi:ankyrin repeat domain-containing protein 50
MLTPARFLWATLQLDWICDQRGDDDILEELERLPLDLCETYDRILERLSQQPPKLREVARKALMWVLYTLRPLTTGELREAIAIEPSMKTHKDLKTKLREKDVIISSTGALLTVENSYNGIVRPIHASVQEYLTRTYEDQTKQHILEFFIDGEFAHSQLAKSCMSYLQLDIFKYGPSPDEINFRGRRYDAPLACYSSFFFDKHIQHLNALPQEIHTHIDLVLNSEERTLASVLQYRRLQGSEQKGIRGFSKFSSAVSAATLIYSTNLYNILQTYRPDSNWLKLAPLKYSLHQAAANNSVDAMQRLVELGQEINQPDEDDTTPLYHSAINGHITSTKWLLEHGAQVNLQSGTYNTALQAASIGGELAAVELLLKHNADANLQGGRYNTALQAASFRGELAVVELLLKHNADVNFQGGRYNTALQAASIRGELAVVELLLEHGAEITSRSLEAACDNQSDDNAIARLLLENGAEVTAKALENASRYERGRCYQMLLDYQARPKKRVEPGNADSEIIDEDHVGKEPISDT